MAIFFTATAIFAIGYLMYHVLEVRSKEHEKEMKVVAKQAYEQGRKDGAEEAVQDFLDGFDWENKYCVRRDND